MTTCESCGDSVDPDELGDVVIEYYNLTPEYTEHYGFCAEHPPTGDERDAVKQGTITGSTRPADSLVATHTPGTK